MKKTINEIYSHHKKDKQGIIVVFLVSFCLSGSFMLSFYELTSNYIGNYVGLFIFFLLVHVLTLGAKLTKEKKKYILYALPWAILFIFVGHNYLRGLLSYLNVLITRWNLVYDYGLLLFKTSFDQNALACFGYLLALIVIQLNCFLVRNRSIISLFFINFINILLVLLLKGNVNVAISLFVVGMFITCVSDVTNHLSKNAGAVIAACTIILFIANTNIYNNNLSSTKSMREQIVNTYYTFRYGKQNLPNGDLSDNLVNYQNDKEMLTVKSGQVKSLYLRAFVGSNIKDGVWQDLSPSAYGNDNTGMLKWLSDRGFDPLNQSATYYSLCGDVSGVEANDISVEVKDASRFYLYTPNSLLKLSNLQKSYNDSFYYSKNLFGSKNYDYSELSSSKPNELLIVENWVNNPISDAQRQYVESEAVYRKFVYDNYTYVDSATASLVNEIFFKDKDEDMTIYSAIVQVRDVLKNNLTYNDYYIGAYEGNVVDYYFNKEKQGDAQVFATLAVEALRTINVPSRYVEGYYIGSNRFDNTNTVIVKGEDAHAWVEVYFDGIGWLAVDVTPGYYYEPVSLREMVGKPNAIKKTVALNESIYKANEVKDINKTDNEVSTSVKDVVNTILIVLGILALFVLLFTLVIIVLEIIRLVIIKRYHKKYASSSEYEKIVLLTKAMYFILNFFGIKANMGFKNAKVDKEIADKFSEQFKAGDYLRVCELVEKALCGGIDLQEYEKRTLLVFIKKLYDVTHGLKFIGRLRYRYYFLTD